MNKFFSGCFITGTDTGVGKTVIATALVRCLKENGISVGVMKPVETGVAHGETDGSDAARLRNAAGIADSPDVVSPYRLQAPLAPLAAARLEGITIEMERIVSAYERLSVRYPCIVVEGVGGVMVPLIPHDGLDPSPHIWPVARAHRRGTDHAASGVERRGADCRGFGRLFSRHGR